MFHNSYFNFYDDVGRPGRFWAGYLSFQAQRSLSQIEEDIREDMVYYRQTHTSFVERMKANKEFQNPKILDQTVSYFGIDGNGTQFEPVAFVIYLFL